MGCYVFQVDALPSDVFAVLLPFLSTFDLLSLSHVNSALFSDLLARGNAVWKQRLRTHHPGILKTVKKHFLTRRTLQFPGILNASRGSKDRGGAVALPNSLHRTFIESSFSVSLWFALESGTPDNRSVYAGGVVLGALSRPWSDENWAFYHQPFIHVDERRNLYCSMTDDKDIVARSLQPDRWYHVVLTFDRQYDHERIGLQNVYVDGQLAHTSAGSLHHAWRQVPHMQLGSGCITGGTKGAPRGQSCWYAFRGLIDNCSVWYDVLSSDEVQRLAKGDETEDSPHHKSVWSLRRIQATAPVFGDVKKVRCLAPTETVHVEIARASEGRGLTTHLKKFRKIFSRR